MRKKEGKILKNIATFMGEKTSMEESVKSKRKKEEEFFYSLMEVLPTLNQRYQPLYELGLDLSIYDDPFHKVIESLIYRYYGELKAQVMMWWVMIQELEDENNLTLKLEDGKEYVVNTPKQLYRVLKKLED